MATEPITVEQAIAAADNAEYLALTVESNNYSETTPEGTVKRTITGMNMDVDGVISTANATIGALEQTASDSAAEAAASASEAANSVSGVDALVTQAEGFATNAEASKIAAALSETNASTSETNASTFASNSENSATASATSETNAETFATNASDSATQAEGFKDGAEIAESNAEAWAAGVNLPAITPSDIGKILQVNDNNSGYELIAYKPVVKNYLEGNSRWNVPYGDSPLPTSTAQTATSFSFFAGNRYCYGQPLVNHTLTGVVFDADSGVYHSFYPSSENMAGKFGAGVLLSDGSISNAGVTLYYEAGNSRNGVAVDMSLAPAHICPVLVPVADATTVTCAVVSEADSWNAAIKPVLLTNSGYTPVGDEPSDVRTDASLPANIANDSRYELTNPFGGNKCNVTVEILVRGVWTPTGQSEHSSLFTGLLAGVVGDKVVIQTAISTLRFDSSSQGSLDLTGYTGTGTVGSAPCRVWVEALRK